MLAVKVLELGAWDLFKPYGDSMAPGAYMLVLKASVALMGTTEYAARFPSFIASLLTLILFYPIARRLVSAEGALIGLAFVGVCKHLIYFGDYVRPYSSDATIALGLLGLIMVLETEQDLGWKRPAAVAFAGAIAVWLSFPAVFVLAGAGTVQIVWAAADRDLRDLPPLAVAYLVPALSFAGLYFVSLGPIGSDEKTMFLMNDYYDYAGAFMPLPTSIEDVKWFRLHLFKLFDFPGGLTMTGLGAFVALVGMFSMAQQSPKRLLILLAPLAMALAASALHRYPFWHRTILYLAPILFMFIGEGIAYLYRTLNSRVPVVAALCFVMLIVVPAGRAARIVVQPTTHHELNKVLDHAEENWQEGDLLYVHWFSSDALPFMEWRYDFPEENMVVEWDPAEGDDPQQVFFDVNLERMKEHGRVWVAGTSDAPENLLPYFGRFDAQATRLDEFEAIGGKVVLFELR